jgi:hypothetical protein
MLFLPCSHHKRISQQVIEPCDTPQATLFWIKMSSLTTVSTFSWSTVPPSNSESVTSYEHPKTPIRTVSPDIDKLLPTVELLRMKDYSNVSKVVECDHLTDENWHKWKEHIRWVFTHCDIIRYVGSTIQRPITSRDPAVASNWDKNDAWAQQVIIQNVTSLLMNHVRSKPTAFLMFGALVDTHKNKAHQTINHIQMLLYETKASKGDDCYVP